MPADSSILMHSDLHLLHFCNEEPLARPEDWLRRCESYRERFPCMEEEHKDAGGFINSYAFRSALFALLQRGAISSTGGLAEAMRVVSGTLPVHGRRA